MTLSFDEIQKCRVKALKSHAENLVLSRWYDCLLYAQERQNVATVQELDLRASWFGGEFVSEIRTYEEAAGIVGLHDQDELVEQFIRDVLGEQLTELGVEPRRVHVYGGLDDAYLVFMLKPGQEPILNP